MRSRRKREIPEINSSSAADLSFLLLLFFILTSSMSPDWIMPMRLSPLPPERVRQEHIKINERNYLPVYIDEGNQIYCRSEKVDSLALRSYVKAFVANPDDEANLPEKVAVNLPVLGDVEVTKNHIISISNHDDALFQTYVFVQNELIAAYRELREDLAQTTFGKAYQDLTQEQQNAIQQYYPRKISRAEKVRKGGST